MARLDADDSTRPRLTPLIVAWRAGHGAITIAFLAAIAHIWICGLTGRRDRALRAAIAALGVEGVVIAANHGDCPLGPLGERIGDPVPLFELVLPASAARRAVPMLGAVAVAGVVLLAAGPRDRDAADRMNA